MAPDALRRAAASLSGARPLSYWLDDPAKPEALPALTGDAVCDLLVVGGGYSGLWTALLAKERDPGREVVLIEAREAGWAASGRNGGFCASSLTHGTANGLERWPGEIAKLEELGARNLDGIEEAVARHGIDCGFERTGEIVAATRPHELADLRAWHRRTEELGLGTPEFLDREQVRAEVDSPAFLGGLFDRRGVAMLHPAKLAWGLKRACLRLGVRVHEHTPGLDLARSGAGIAVRTPYGRVFARRAALGTNVFPSLVARLRPYTVPVYDYALMTEPLSAGQLASIGWRNRQGMSDGAHRFHYFRMSSDHRILWGGYDAVYPYGGRLDSALDQRPETFLKLAQHFFEYFPQLSGVRFSHAWGGAIDTCSRFSAFFATAYGGRVAHAAGYTGLGVGATRFGAEVMLDLLAGERTERTGLRMVRSRPLPFPPEPFAWAGISLTKRSMARADSHGGHRDPWLRAMDRLGFGFDS